jgi:hypothetical protein
MAQQNFLLIDILYVLAEEKDSFELLRQSLDIKI